MNALRTLWVEDIPSWEKTLTDQAAATASAIEQSVATLASTAAVLNTIASTVNLLGRVLVVLGI